MGGAGPGGRGGPSASTSEVEAGGRHDVRRTKRARAPTTSETPNCSRGLAVQQTRRLLLAVVGERDREIGG